MNRIDAAIADHLPGLWPFIPAGLPDMAGMAALIRRIAELPVRGIEIGFPFSDSVADGPVIQDAFGRALASGTKVADVLGCVQSIRGDVDVPVLAMVSASIVYRRGVDRFVDQAADAGFDGLIVPDVSLEESPPLVRAAERRDLRLAMLVAPTTPPERRVEIGKSASGFLYCVSIQGTTGERDGLATGLADYVRSVKSDTGRPAIVGFGVTTAEDVRSVCEFADGAIVGSAIVRRMLASIDAGDESSKTVDATVAAVEGLLAS